MKTGILTIVLALTLSAVKSDAQRATDLSLRIVTPSANAILQSRQGYPLQIVLKNNGPDMLRPADTIGINWIVDNSYQVGNGPLPLWRRSGYSLNVGDSIAITEAIGFDVAATTMYNMCIEDTVWGISTDMVSDAVRANNRSCIPITVTLQSTSVEEAAQAGGAALSIYPNPARNQLRLSGAKGQRMKVGITDLTGKMWMQIADYSGSEPLDVSLLAPGGYLLIVTKQDGTRSVARFNVSK